MANIRIQIEAQMWPTFGFTQHRYGKHSNPDRSTNVANIRIHTEAQVWQTFGSK